VAKIVIAEMSSKLTEGHLVLDSFWAYIIPYQQWRQLSQCTWLFSRGGTGSEFGRVPDPGTQSLLPGRIRVVAGSGYLTCDAW